MLSSNFLLLNDKKTALIEYNSNDLNQNNNLVIGNTVIDTQPGVTNLGCVLDIGLVMSGHATLMCKSAYHHLRCIRKIRNCIPMEACKLLEHSLVTSRLDYSNALVWGARDDVIKQLERVQRIAATGVCKEYTNDHSSVTELPWGLHWNELRECTSVDVFKETENASFPSSLLTVIPLFSRIISRVLILLLSTCIFSL